MLFHDWLGSLVLFSNEKSQCHDIFENNGRSHFEVSAIRLDKHKLNVCLIYTRQLKSWHSGHGNKL